jgi:predicted MFS family arabinose efflux permease
VQVVGAASAVLVDAVSYLVSAVALALMRVRETVAESSAAERIGRSLRADMAEGLRYVLRHPLLRPITACTGTANLFGGVCLAVEVLYLTRVLHLSAGVIGVVLAVGLVGGVLGAMSGGWWIRRVGQGRMVLWALLVTGPPTLLMVVPGAVWFAAGTFAMSYGAVIYNVAQVSFRQSVCPNRLLGRMNASIRFLVWGTIPLGGLLGGALAEGIGIWPTLLVSVLGMIAAPLWLVASPLRRLRDLPTDEPAAVSPTT